MHALISPPEKALPRPSSFFPLCVARFHGFREERKEGQVGSERGNARDVGQDNYRGIAGVLYLRAARRSRWMKDDGEYARRRMTGPSINMKRFTRPSRARASERASGERGLNQQSQTSVKEARGVAFICVVGGCEREGGREGTRDREDQGCRIGALHYFTAGVHLQLRSAFAFLSGLE